MGRRALPIALFVALALAAAALVLRAASGTGAGPDRPASDLLPLLFAAGGLCAGGLLRERAPAGAWLATVSVGGIAALVILGAVRSLLPVTEIQRWPWLVLVAVTGVVAAAGVAAAYASRGHAVAPARWHRAWLAAVLVGLVVVAAGGAWAVTDAFAAPMLAADPPSTELPALRISARLAAGFITVMALAGMLRDLSGPLGRARSRAGSMRELPRAVAEELLPSASSARRRAREEERARIAADLHALVLPDLRRAVRAAEDAEAADAAGGRAAPESRGGRSRPAVADLREAVEGIERLMHERQSIVLEEYGLVAGLEWLAERTQQRAPIAIDMALEGAHVGNAGAVPPPIARAAFRVALLALDNVVRHAGASRALVRLDVEAGRVRLAVVDDGRGIDDAAAPRAGRGLIDMRTAASEIGATLKVERRDGGTAVEMTWASATAAADEPATGARDVTARPSAPRT